MILETERLLIRRFNKADADFICQLLSNESFIANIGDKGVRTIEDALDYLVHGPLLMYKICGFGLYHVALKESHESIGMCGLIQRDGLDDVDIGFAFLPQHWSKGYAYESAGHILAYARDVIKLKRLVGITYPSNAPSVRLLEKLGLRFERYVHLPHDASLLCLYVLEFNKNMSR